MNLSIEQKTKITKSIKNNKHLLTAFILLIFVAIFISHANKPQAVAMDNQPIQADTILPKGYILYPIQLENIEAIRGVINQYGVIDVYLSLKNGNRSKKLLSKVKIMQAPYNPNEFALLLPDSMSQKLMSETGPFLGIIQNRSENADFSEVDTVIKKKKINIEYQKGS
jgi:hypothetical protein